ncbi:hypothetical protein [Actinocorallia aurantiaca]|jgi:hypothetical protein|uniref:Uncharacterized protein n=1 Tax=Actinocorallia aurantiaca TaxID=46204 RepID=A0ABN3UDZ6_9ACTN
MTPAPRSPARVPVKVLMLVGDQAEILIPAFKFTVDNPLRVPVDGLLEATGLERSRLPGRRLTALVSETFEDGVQVAEYELIK